MFNLKNHTITIAVYTTIAMVLCLLLATIDVTAQQSETAAEKFERLESDARELADRPGTNAEFVAAIRDTIQADESLTKADKDRLLNSLLTAWGLDQFADEDPRERKFWQRQQQWCERNFDNADAVFAWLRDNAMPALPDTTEETAR